MQITAYTNSKFSEEVDTYDVMLNPEKLLWARSIVYNDDGALGTSKPLVKFNKSPSGTISFDLVIDCTGVVDSNRVNLPKEIEKLTKILYAYNGKIHSPNFVTINWGKQAHSCVLTKFDLSYTFFKPDGTPLRATIRLAFKSVYNPVLAAIEANQQSPDMTHLRPIVDGDSLPQISQQIYDSPNYYIQIAKFNGLDKFRQLRSGSTIVVPPLIAAKANNV